MAEPTERPRLNLKPRDPAAAKKAEAERAAKNAGIFGAAKPREAVLAERAGVREEDVLAKEAASEDLKIRLTPEQSRIKRDAEAEIEGLRKQVDEVQDVSERARVVAEIDQKERELEEMMRQFEEMAVQNAREGKYQSVRAQQAQRNAIQGSGDPFGGPASFDGFPAYPDEREFGYGRGRGGRGGGGGRGRGRMGPGPGGYGGGSGWEQEGGFPDMGFPPPAAFDGGRGFGGGRGFYDAPDQGAGYVAPMGGGGFDSFNGVRGRGRGRRNGNGGGYNGGRQAGGPGYGTYGSPSGGDFGSFGGGAESYGGFPSYSQDRL